MKCAILDYGTGNLQSVQNAIEHLGHDAFRINNFDDISSVDVLIFPGQGAFGPAMHQLESMNLIGPLQQYVASNKPFIGICLGFQLLFNGSSESEKAPGLNCLDGYFDRFSGNELSIPHMGWNTIHATNTNTILDGFNNERFYFVHSYFLPTSSDRNIATTNYGITFTSAMANKTQLITQFHPEKSGEVGLKLLKTYLDSLL
jgi:glutamine amidotransferase/cyclase